MSHRIGRPGRLVLSALLVALLVGLPVERFAATAEAAPTVSLRTKGSPFDPDGDGIRERVRIELELPEAATVDLDVRDFHGPRLRVLARHSRLAAGIHEWTWNGRDSRGRRVPEGAYRVRASVRLASGRLVRKQTWVTRAARIPYRARPGAIVVAVDPGHGGPAAGAVWRGLPEDDVNLDIGLRLEAMLKGSGVRVVMTRRTDRNVSPVGLDLTGDRRYTRVDELIARNDIANLARADVHIAIHNNGVGCHCVRGTEMYTHFGRSWSPEGRSLARLVLEAHMHHLRRLPGFRPRNLGVKSHAFKALKPYHPRRMPRPSLQPSILGESLFIDDPAEHRILASRSGRAAIAAAYFDGIARYLASRRFGLSYAVLEAPQRVRADGAATVRLRLTNSGRAVSRGWRLVARVVPAVLRYDGRPRAGRVVASIPVPDGLGPGESTEVTLVGIPMPARRGRWLIKLDTDRPGGDSLSRHGVVGPQLRVRTASR